MDYTKYIVEIKNACIPSPSKDVLDRMLERDANSLDRSIHEILERVVQESQEDYRGKLVENFTRALAPFTQGMIEKLVPKPDNPLTHIPWPPTGIQI